jgi:D-lactate dehydrogenase (cytochrome)
VHHRARTRAPRAAPAPPVEHDADVLAGFLSDAAHVPGGYTSGVTFPDSEDAVSAAVAGAGSVLPIGAQSSLTGGATPRGELLLSTRRLTAIGALSDDTIDVGAGVSLAELHRHLAVRHMIYPPAPTYEGAFVGGTIATNAAGAGTFKYGSTRDWVSALTVVLANGEILDIERGQTLADDGAFEVILAAGARVHISVPSYRMPAVRKLSAGYFARPGMDLVDLFVGSEGTLAVIVSARLRVIARPLRYVALIRCADETQALSVTGALRREAGEAWHGNGPLDIAAIEYMDRNSLATVPDHAFERAGVQRPRDASVLLLVQIETGLEAAKGSAALERLATVLAAQRVADDPHLAEPSDARAAERLIELREAVPASVNAAVSATKARVHPDIQKTAGDMIVPFERLADSIALYRRAFADRHLDHAIWGHVSDGNLHPNVLPRSLDDVRRGEEAIVEIARGVLAMGGAPLAEHGVGRSRIKQRLLNEMYGEAGIEQMRAVKRALDPTWKLAPGVLFPAPSNAA